MNIKKFIYVIITLNSYCFYSQYEVDPNINKSNFTLANPDVSNFEKFSLNPVNYYVGKPIISIPIIGIKTGNIDYPLNLSYDAGGIKVDQIASNVGLGWNLNRTILTRTINQDNDFDNTGCLDLQPDVSTYSMDDRIADYHAVRGVSGKIGYFLQKHTNAKMNDQRKSIDYIPDVYHFYTNGFSTSFFFNDENTPVEINPQGTVIKAVKSKKRFEKNTRIFGLREYNLMSQDFFTICITTKDKIKYTFSDCDISFNQDLVVNNRNPSGHNSDPPAQVSAWHITKIEDLKTLKKIDFVYSDIYPNPNHDFFNTLDTSLAQRNFEFISEPSNSYSFDFDCYYPTMGVIRAGGYYLDSNARIDHISKYLRKIIYDEGEIIFKYSGDGDPENNQSGGSRHDVFRGEYLSDIISKNKNLDIIKSFKFGYNYFESNYNVGEFNPDNDNNSLRYKRLKLISFQENNKPLYKLTYNENKQLPPINSFSVDFLGYYNNSIDVSNISIFATIKPKPTLYFYPNRLDKSLLAFPLTNLNGTTIPGYFDRRASNNIDDVQAWSLRKIEFPTGGYSEFIYESNDFEESGQNIKGGGIRIMQQKIDDANGNLRILNYSYLKQDGSLSSGKLFNMPFFGHPTQIFFPVSLNWSNPVIITTPTPNSISSLTSFRFFGKSNLNVDINSGSYVGYSRVSKVSLVRVEKK